CNLESGDGWMVLGLALVVVFAIFAGHKLVTAFFTVRALALAPALSRRLSQGVKSRDYVGEEVLRADGAGERWVALRRQAIDRLAGFFQARSAKSIAWGNGIRESFSDLRFTDANRVPFPFVRVMREKFSLCSVVTASEGPRLRDLDGHWTLDVSGSYGLNVAG